MNKEIKIGDIVRLTSCIAHHSNVYDYDRQITFSINEINNHIEILDIITKVKFNDEIAYKVKCNKGITYLRRAAFELLNIEKEIIIEEDYSYLIKLLNKLGIK